MTKCTGSLAEELDSSADGMRQSPKSSAAIWKQAGEIHPLRDALALARMEKL